MIAAAIVQGADRRTFWPLVHAPIGWLGGSALGYWLYTSFRADSWPLAVMMPASFGFLGGAIAARLAVSPRKVTHLRGTRVGVFTGGRGGRLRARLTGGVTLAGVPLSREDETMHVAAIGATGSGKSTALRALMADAIRRGDRQVVADPDGAAMSAFFEPGDVILNPFDRRCARGTCSGKSNGRAIMPFSRNRFCPTSALVSTISGSPMPSSCSRRRWRISAGSGLARPATSSRRWPQDRSRN